jgi:hypothetical protein
MAHNGFYFRDKAHLIKMLKQHAGVYSIKLPLTDEQIFQDIIVDDTLMTFSSYYPKLYVLPANLNQLRVPNARESTTDAVSDIYELPNLYPLTEGVNIMGIAKIVPFNAMGYESATYAYETIDAFQALAISQGIANLSSMIEPPLLYEYIGGRRFRLNNGTYYRSHVIIYIEMSFHPELFDIPPGQRIAFSQLAELDFRRNIYNNLKYWNELRSAAAEYNLRIDDWSDAESARNDLLDSWNETFHMERTAVVVF